MGVFLEAAALAVLFYAVGRYPVVGPVGAVVLLAVQAMAAFLVHCPAHWIIGSVLGVRFRRISLARSTMAAALPAPLEPIAGLVPVLRLSVKDRGRSSPSRLRAMYLSGAVASVGTALVIAAAVTLTGDVIASVLTWAYALFYFASDILLSPKGGDLMRARLAGGARPAPHV